MRAPAARAPAVARAARGAIAARAVRPRALLAAAVRPLRAPALLAAAVLALLAVGAPARAHAEAVSGAELRALAARAASDPAALERLRRVDRVDGRPAAVARALAGVSGRALRARLAVLGQQPAAPPSRLEDPGGEAHEILAGRRYSPPRLPGPFRGVIDRLADWLSPVIGLIPALDDVVPGGRPVVWALVALLVAAGAAALAGRARRRRRRLPGAGAPAAAPPPEDPETLERRAREAAARGEHELAVRLGFRAGLGRLDRRGTIRLRPSLSTTEVARTLRSPEFDRAAARFDAVAYGGRRAAAADVDAAQADWTAVLGDGRRA